MIFFPLTQKIIFITNTLFTIFYTNTLHCFFFHISTYLQSLLNHLIPNFLRQLNHRIIIKLYRTYILFFRLRITFYLIYIPPADCPDIFKNIHHTIYRGRAYLLIFGAYLIINFLAAGTILFKYNIQNHKPLLCNSASLFSQLLQNYFLLHLYPLNVKIRYHSFSLSYILLQFQHLLVLSFPHYCNLSAIEHYLLYSHNHHLQCPLQCAQFPPHCTDFPFFLSRTIL